MTTRCEQIGDATLYLSDCAEVIPTLEAVSAVLTDPPYGITENRWDTPAPFETLWAIKSPVFVLTASQPFTASAVMSKPEWFRHEWIWQKNAGSNFANTVREPMKEHESVLVFAPERWTYNPIMQARAMSGLDRAMHDVKFKTASENYREFEDRPRAAISEQRVPSSVQPFNRERGLHPTQKPVLLFDYLARTYTNAGDVILDPFMGSGTTGVAALKAGRKFIGIEREAEYFEIACKRVREAIAQPSLFGGMST